VTIDLVNLNQITVSADKKQVSIGPGNRWLGVYSKLDKLGLSVVGGRIEDIGVGGLTLGGGISYLSHRFGFGSDNVNAYEV
jgi:FAD/FMN-containing dehydrogenase